MSTKIASAAAAIAEKSEAAKNTMVEELRDFGTYNKKSAESAATTILISEKLQAAASTTGAGTLVQGSEKTENQETKGNLKG